MNVAVFGATGTIGRALVGRLRGDHEVVAISRRPRPDEPGVRWAVADVGNPTAVRDAVEGVDVVY